MDENQEKNSIMRAIRQFESGATRDTDDGKLDYEGFLSPLALERYARYMHRHRVQADGRLRDSDNWTKGIPIPQYMKSLWRHHIEAWKAHRGYPAKEALQDSLCGILFNTFGALHELLKLENKSPDAVTSSPDVTKS